MARLILCDGCGCDITDKDRFIFEVNKYTPEKMVPAFVAREICAGCKEELREYALRSLGKQTT